MQLRFVFVFSAALLCSSMVQPAIGQSKISAAESVTAFKHSARLQNVVEAAAQTALREFAGRGLQTNQFAVTLVDLQGPAPEQGSFRGEEQIYPASVVKLFYLTSVHRWLEDGKLKDTPELRRGMRDMIVDSLNEATGYLVDCLTGTTSGPELSPAEMDEWYYKRNAVNRYFSSLGYTNINVNRKPWCEGPYGREMQSVQMHKSNQRNWLTTDATARLLAEIAQGKAVSEKRSAEMMALLQRDPFGEGDKNDQAHAFTGLALPKGAKLWSKAGWTSTTRHDAAYVELPGGEKFVLVIFTVDHANERALIPAIAKSVIDGIAGHTKD